MRKAGFLLLALVIMIASGLGLVLASPSTVAADDASTTGEDGLRPDRIRVSSKYPAVTGPADTSFVFQLELLYQLTDIEPGMEHADLGRLQSRVFDLELTGPDGWQVFTAESSWRLDRRISSIRLLALGVPTTLVVVAYAPWWDNLEPGEYPIDLTVRTSDGALEESINMKAVVTAWYGMEATTTTGRLNAKTTGGNPAVFDVVVVNTGSDVMDKVSITSSRPSGIANEQWVVRFEPDAIRELAPGDEQQIRVSVTPPEKTISGDYYLTLDFRGDPTVSDYPPSLEMRVSVETKPQWVAIGMLIVVLCVAGLMYSFYTLRQR